MPGNDTLTHMELKAGFAVSDITPPVGVELCGFGWYLGRKSTGIIEPLLARACVWEAGNDRGAIISCDLVGVGRDLAAAVRTAVSRDCGMPIRNILVCASHTHSGPATIDLIGWGEKDPEYLAALPGRIAAAANSALRRMSRVTLSYGEAPVRSISFNREYAGGWTDTRVRVLSFRSNDGFPGFFASFACHPVVMCGQTTLMSGDFVGIAVNKVAAGCGTVGRGKDDRGTAGYGTVGHGTVGLFLQGAAGDQNPVYRFQPQEQAIQSLHLLADRFAACIQNALDRAEPVRPDPARMEQMEITIPQSPPDRHLLVRNLLLAEDMLKRDSLPEDLALRFRLERAVHEAVLRRYERPPLDGRRTEVQAVRFGDVVLVSQPAELFLRYQREAEASLAPLKTIVIGYANDYVGYVPSPDRYELEERRYSYPAYFVPFLLGEFPFREDAASTLLAGMVDCARNCR